MAKINLHVEAEDGGDLRNVLLQILGFATDQDVGVIAPGTMFDPEGAFEEIDNEEEPAPNADVNDQGEPQQAKRKRRTKAEMEAIRAAEQAALSDAVQAAGSQTQVVEAATDVSVVGAVTEAGTEATGADTTAPTGQAEIDPFKLDPTPATTSPTTSSVSQGSGSDVTINAVREALTKFVGEKGAPAALPIFAQFKKADGEPANRITELLVKDYAAAIELLKV